MDIEDLDYPNEELGHQAITCTTCDHTLWTRGHPFADLRPCPHLLLFTDCEAELPSWCVPELLAWARAALADEEDDDPLAREGWLHTYGNELLDLLPRPADPALYAVRIDGEYCVGVLITTAAVRIHA